MDLHLREVFRNDEERRCREAGRDGLTGLHVPHDDRAIDGRADDRVPQVGTRPVERCLGGKDAGACRLHRRLSIGQLSIADKTVLVEILLTIVVADGLVV